MASKTESLMFPVIKFWNCKFYFIWKEIIQSLCSFWIKSERLFIFRQIYFLAEHCLLESKGYTVFWNFEDYMNNLIP